MTVTSIVYSVSIVTEYTEYISVNSILRIAIIGTSAQSCWLAEACKCYLGHQNNRNREKKQIVLA